MNNFRATLVAKLITNLIQFTTDHFHQAIWVRQNLKQLSNALQDLFKLGNDLVLLKAGQFLQTQIEDCLSLRFG